MASDGPLRRLADDTRPQSLSNRMRSQRFARFERLVASLPRPLSILDVGGTNEFWEQRGWAGRDDVEITVLNVAAAERRHDNVHPVLGDATDLSRYATGSFDVVFSNSVIEHLFTERAQAAMAREVRRLGRRYWVQTPNFWFPMEPHFLVPGWQWLPVSARVAIIRRRRCGWRGPYADPAEARAAVREVRLLRRSDLLALFPGAAIVPERFAGMTKSFVVQAGFPVPATEPRPAARRRRGWTPRAAESPSPGLGAPRARREPSAHPRVSRPSSGLRRPYRSSHPPSGR